MSFVALKSGLFLGAGAEHAGVVLLDDLGVVRAAVAGVRAAHAAHRRERARGRPAARVRANRTRASNGRVLVVGGGAGMPGALRAGGRGGAARRARGSSRVAGRRGEPRSRSPPTRPELIYLPVSSRHRDLDEALRAADVLAIGPGLGTGDWAQRLWAAALRAPACPTVADADALNLLALNPVETAGRTGSSRRIRARPRDC